MTTMIRGSKPRDYRHGLNRFSLININGTWFVSVAFGSYKIATIRKLAAWLEKAARFMEGK
jgi:hypothetical protein